MLKIQLSLHQRQNIIHRTKIYKWNHNCLVFCFYIRKIDKCDYFFSSLFFFLQILSFYRDPSHFFSQQTNMFSLSLYGKVFTILLFLFLLSQGVSTVSVWKVLIWSMGIRMAITKAVKCNLICIVFSVMWILHWSIQKRIYTWSRIWTMVPSYKSIKYVRNSPQKHYCKYAEKNKNV